MDKEPLFDALHDSDLTHEQGRSVLLALIRLSEAKEGILGFCRVQYPQHHIGKISGVCTMTAHRHMQKLKERGLIGTTKIEGRDWIEIRTKEVLRLNAQAEPANSS